jgi:hypothetical protein
MNNLSCIPASPDICGFMDVSAAENVSRSTGDREVKPRLNSSPKTFLGYHYRPVFQIEDYNTDLNEINVPILATITDERDSNHEINLWSMIYKRILWSRIQWTTPSLPCV